MHTSQWERSTACLSGGVCAAVGFETGVTGKEWVRFTDGEEKSLVKENACRFEDDAVEGEGGFWRRRLVFSPSGVLGILFFVRLSWGMRDLKEDLLVFVVLGRGGNPLPLPVVEPGEKFTLAVADDVIWVSKALLGICNDVRFGLRVRVLYTGRISLLNSCNQHQKFQHINQLTNQSGRWVTRNYLSILCRGLQRLRCTCGATLHISELIFSLALLSQSSHALAHYLSSVFFFHLVFDDALSRT